MAGKKLQPDQIEFVLKLLKDSNRPLSSEELIEALLKRFSQ
jgi:hypothetical protein